MGLVTFLFILHHAQALEFPRYKEECSANSDCFDDYEYCNAGLEDAVCYHKEPYPNIYPSEWLGYIAIFFMMIFANCGGLGGGASVMPLSMIFFGFNAKEAIVLSNASITVSAIVRYV